MRRSVLAHHVPEQLGQRRPPLAEPAHRAGRQRRPQHGLVVGAVVELQRPCSPVLRRRTRTPGQAVGPARRGACGASTTSRRGAARPQLVDRCRPPPSVHCGRCRPGRTAARPGRAGGWRTPPGCPRRPSPAAPGSSRRRPPGRARRTARRARGSRGSCTSDAASCTRCWLPRLSFCTSSSRRAATPSRSSHRSTDGRRRGRRHAVQAGQVDELLADLHLRVEPALLRHVADLAAGVQRQRPRRPSAPRPRRARARRG